MENKITLFASNEVSIECPKFSYSCLMHCTGTYSDLISASRYFRTILKNNKYGDVTDIYNKFSVLDLQILKEYILCTKNVLKFHVNIKDVSYYYFIYFWTNVLFKGLKLEGRSLWYEMINDVYLKINKNNFNSFIDVNIAAPFRSRDNICKKVIENVYAQIQASNVCTDAIKIHSEKFVPFTGTSLAYIHKQSESFKKIRMELKHKNDYIKRESTRLTHGNITSKIYIDESYTFSTFVDYLQEQQLNISIADSSFEEIKMMLKYLSNLFSSVFQKLENLNNLSKLERSKLFYITFTLFQLLKLDELELEVSDGMFEKLFELSNNSKLSLE